MMQSKQVMPDRVSDNPFDISISQGLYYHQMKALSTLFLVKCPFMYKLLKKDAFQRLSF
ncbi:hypothetical protein [uncultured Vagococcus sp.]|uniref:hypothetical protein n=1 Tax=uncultured Vagococcus sp. TaxID=189676 RepID=UPI0028D1C383|nr:hypothetical protein [uncultured Vagococcus sp.]